MWFIFLIIVVMLFIAVLEKSNHQKDIDSIPIRINVNGIRGKSTVTRLITGIMVEAGYRTVGKTTGTSARMIYWNRGNEKHIRRRPEGPNIREQKEVVYEIAKLKADCLVSECMAINPDYQTVFQEQMLQANIGVIVNVLEDHMDIMGPTLKEVAEGFISTIPYNGTLVISDSPFVYFFKREAYRRNTKVIIAKNLHIKESYLSQFAYMIFPENAAIALAVSEVLKIDKEIAFQGMLNAHPDPGAMRILPLGYVEPLTYFVNAFAANDPSSTLNIWKRLKKLGISVDRAMVIMNCRADRLERTEQFANDVLPYLQIDTLVLIGQATGPIVTAFKAGLLPANQMLNLENKSIKKILEAIKGRIFNGVIYGIGNIHGSAEILCKVFEKLYERSNMVRKRREKMHEIKW